MIVRLTPEQISNAFLKACETELKALKPGNVHIHADGHSMTVAEFEKSAKAAAKPISRKGLNVGDRILQAIEATQSAVSCNTNLGIILLAAPLVQAAIGSGDQPYRQRLANVLTALTIQDAVLSYKAIRMAQPGNLGEVAEHDISKNPDITLFEAMRQSEHRDRISWQYTHVYSDVFELGLVRLQEGLQRWNSLNWAATHCYLGFLSAFSDTLIQRKWGTKSSEDIRQKAQHIDDMITRHSNIEEFTPLLMDFDRELKSRKINPGTSADLTVATLFVHQLFERSIEANR